MGIDDLVEKVKSLSDEERKQLLQLLRGSKTTRRKRELPPEAAELLREYDECRERMRQIRNKLKELGIKKVYDFRGTPLYNTIKQIIAEYGRITVEDLAEELKSRGYRWSGATAVCLRNLREDGLIEKEGGELVWRGNE
ncbi:MAG: hypothetical protein QXI45_01885 [Thermofilaceae archaeon]